MLLGMYNKEELKKTGAPFIIWINFYPPMDK